MKVPVLLLAALLGPATPCRAQGFVEHVEPPVLERGKTTRVTVFGSRLGTAQGLWTSLPAAAVRATPVGEPTAGRAVLDIAVAADAPVGIFGVRLATADGLANAVLLLIDDIPIRQAPVDTQKVKVQLPAALWGRFREANVDRFLIDVTAGQRVSFEAVGNRFGKDVDPLVTIRDLRGRIVVEHDNDPGLYFDCRFEHVFAEAGTYTVEMRDARFHGSTHWFYVLRMGRFPAARVAVPVVVPPGGRVKVVLPELAGKKMEAETPAGAEGVVFGVMKGDDGSAWLPLEVTQAASVVHREPGDTIEEGTPARVPAALCGVLQKRGARHFFRLELSKGQRIQVRAEARAFNSPADLEIAITDGKGKELRRAGENAQGEIAVDFTASASGNYGLTVRDANRDGGPAFAYRLDVGPPQPRIQVHAEVEGLTLPRGDFQSVPLVVTRSDYKGSIALKLLGAPAGVVLTPGEIGADVNAIVCKLSASPEATLGVHSLQILARPTEIEGARPTLVRTQPLIDRQIVNVDLIPHALREDQRRLPPALTDRFAVQVTPPSPFTFELPEASVTLGRYQHVDFPIVVARTRGFTAPLTFVAKGGQIAPKGEGRTRVYAELAEGKGSIHSRILTNLVKHRVEVTAAGAHEGRRISLTRAFELDVRSAFVVSAEPVSLKLEPGAVAAIRLKADRLKTFDGPITVQLSPGQGLDVPEKIVIPAGSASAAINIRVAPDRANGRQSINLSATAQVNGFEEEQRARVEVDVVKMKPAKK